MHILLLAIVLGAAALLLLRMFANADPKLLAKLIRVVGGGLALVGIVFFLLTGRFVFAVALTVFALRFLGLRLPFNLPGMGFPGGSGKSAGQTSRVRTAMLEMELDHDSGDVDGVVIEGRFEGRRLSDLSRSELYELYDECIRAGDQSVNLLEAFLDSMHPDWRSGEGAPSGAGAAGRDHGGSSGGGAMDRNEALEVLGLAPDASGEDIRSAHKRLMKRFHPDHGGSSYLAARINQAKDKLLGNH